MLDKTTPLKPFVLISKSYTKPIHLPIAALSSCHPDILYCRDKYNIYKTKDSFNQISDLIVSHIGMPKSICLLSGKVVGANNWDKINITQQYHALYNEAGIFEASAMYYWEIIGADAESIIHTLSPCNISNLKIGQAKFIILTTQFGTIDDEAVILKLDHNHFLVSSGGCKEFTYLPIAMDRYPNVKIFNNIDMVSFNIKGPKKLEAIANLLSSESHTALINLKEFEFKELKLKNNQQVIVLKNKIGIEVWGASNTICWAWDYILSTKQDLIVPCGWDVLHVYRMECKAINFALYPLDINHNINLIEAGLGWMRSSNNLNYIGSNYLNDQIITKRLTKIRAVENPDLYQTKSGDILYNVSGHEVGIMTSVAYSPMFSTTIAFAHISSETDPKQRIFSFNSGKFFEWQENLYI